MYLNGLPTMDEVEDVWDCAAGRHGEPDCLHCRATDRWRYLLCDAVASGALDYYADGHIENVTGTKQGMAFLKQTIVLRKEGRMKAEKKKMAKISVHGKTHEVAKERLELERLLKRGIMLTQKRDRLDEELGELKSKIEPFGLAEMKVSGRKSAQLIGAAGLCEVTVRSSFSIADANVPAILDVLGEEVGEKMILQKIAYKPSTAMKRLLADGDDPRGVKLRLFVDVKETKSVRFVAK